MPYRVISGDLKLGGSYKFLGGVNMREAQIYNKKHEKQKKKNTLSRGGVVSQRGRGSLPS